MIIAKNKVVAIFYSIWDENGLLVDSNESYSPTLYLQGSQNIITELEVGLEGLSVGDKKEIIAVKNAETNLAARDESASSDVELTKNEHLRFNVEVVSVRDATPAEINAGFPLAESLCSGKPGCC